MSVHLNVIMSIPGKEPRTFEYEFNSDRISLGREQDNDIQIPLSTVSRNHAVLFREGEEWYVEDLKSTHGTQHNGKPLGQGGKKLLRNGDSVEVVHFKISFQLGGDGLSEDYSVERTEALAQKMVQEVLASIGADGEMPYLRVMNGPDEGAQYQLLPDRNEVIVGRGQDCDFQINDANISRQHALIRRDWSDITIEDQGSKNGVIINDRKIVGQASLRDADEILLGAVRLTFIDPSAKFIGKLDDIPAFATATLQGSEEAIPAPEPEPEEPMPEPEPAPEPVAPPVAMGTAAEEEEEEPLVETGSRGLGVVEYALIGVAGLVIVGLGVGVILVLASG